MRLPAHLLHQIRWGVGVGAVLLAGCDLADRVTGALDDDAEQVAAADSEVAEAKPATEATTPEAGGSSRKSGGIAGKVAEAVGAARSEPLPSIPEPRLLEEPKPEPEPEPEPDEDVTAFVPFGGSAATAPRIEPRPKRHPRPIALAEAPEEPCDPELSEGVLGTIRPTPRVCGPCGRG